jgi:pimeloyl-ACP methyl ester carboxylesterase
MPAPVEETIAADDGAGLHAVTEGRGRPLVLCHGGPGGADTLGPLAALVTDIALVHRYDQCACGRSDGGPPFTMARWVADLDALRRHWGHRCWVVGGHSFGAALAIAYALEHPERTEAVIYVSCIVRLHGQPDCPSSTGGRGSNASRPISEHDSSNCDAAAMMTSAQPWRRSCGAWRCARSSATRCGPMRWSATWRPRVPPSTPR